MTRLHLLAATLLLTSPTDIASAESAGQDVATTGAVTGQAFEQARALVELMTPSDLMVATNIKAWEEGVAKVSKADPATQKLEESFPGIIAAGIAGGRSAALTYCRKYVRTIGEHKAGLVAARLSPAEMTQASTFYARPAWRRFVTRLMGNIDTEETLDEAVGSLESTGKVAMTEETMRRTLNQAARASGGQTPAADQIDLMRFTQTPVAAKIKQIGEESDRHALGIANNPDPVAVAEQQRAMQQAMIAFADARKK